MATTITQGRRKDVEDYLYSWVGQDKSGKAVRGEMRAHDAGHRAFVGQRERGISERVRPLDHFLRVRRAAQEGKIGEAVKFGVRGKHASA